MKWLIVDCNNILWKAYHGRKRSREFGKVQFSFEEEVYTTFLMMVLSYQRRFATDGFIWCWDQKPYKRNELQATYKNHVKGFIRESGYSDDKDVCARMANTLKTELLSKCGFKNIFFQVGYEADDIIASVCESIADRGEHAIIASSDSDLMQLLCPWITLFGPHTGTVLTDKGFKQKYLIDPKDWWKVKAIGGCKADCVAGIENVGETRALYFVQGKSIPQTKVGEKMVELHDEFLNRNGPLVRIPFHGTATFSLRKDKVTKAKWHKVMEKYNLGRMRVHMPLEVITSE